MKYLLLLLLIALLTASTSALADDNFDQATLQRAILSQLVASKVAAEEQLRGLEAQRKSLTDQCGVLRIRYRTAAAFEEAMTVEGTTAWLKQAEAHAPEQVAAVQQRLAETRQTQAETKRQATETTARVQTVVSQIAKLEDEIAELDRLILSAPASATEYYNSKCRRRLAENQSLAIDRGPSMVSLVTPPPGARGLPDQVASPLYRSATPWRIAFYKKTPSKETVKEVSDF